MQYPLSLESGNALLRVKNSPETSLYFGLPVLSMAGILFGAILPIFHAQSLLAVGSMLSNGLECRPLILSVYTYP